MIDFKNKKVMLICAGIAVVIIALTITGVILKQKSDDKKAQKAEQDRIAQEEKKKTELEAIAIAEATSTVVAVETPAVTTPTTTAAPTTTTAPKTTTTPKAVVTPTPTPTPIPDPVVSPTALTVTAKYYANGETPPIMNSGIYTGYYSIDVLLTPRVTLNYTAVAGTTPTVTIEKLSGNADYLIKHSDFDYTITEGWIDEIIFRVDLKDANGTVVKTGKCKMMVSRG